MTNEQFAAYHKRKAQECLDKFNVLNRRCYRGPNWEEQTGTLWSRYEKHRDMAEFYNQKRENPA